MRTITCVIHDNYLDKPNPLIYQVEVADPNNAEEVLAAVTKERMNDLGELDKDDELDLELLFAFDGSPRIVADWRD